MWGILSVCAALLCACPASPLLVHCGNDGAQCREETYCDTDAHVCRPCLDCQDLKRDPPVGPYLCIKSVAECGACYKGLVADLRSGGVNAECVPPDPEDGGGMASYLWLIVVGALVFIGLFVGIIIYVARNPEMFKTAAASQPSITARFTASAPEAPPPYNPLPYKDARPPSPPQYNGHAAAYEAGYNEDSRFIAQPQPPRPADARVQDASQTAKVYNKPAYLREPRSPSPDLVSEPKEPTDFTIEEETRMSTWTHGGDDVNATSAGGELAAGGELVPAPAKKRCVRQDTNNNRNRDSSSGESEASPRSPSPGHSASPFSVIFNVVQINNNK